MAEQGRSPAPPSHSTLSPQLVGCDKVISIFIFTNLSGVGLVDLSLYNGTKHYNYTISRSGKNRAKRGPSRTSLQVKHVNPEHRYVTICVRVLYIHSYIKFIFHPTIPCLEGPYPSLFIVQSDGNPDPSCMTCRQDICFYSSFPLGIKHRTSSLNFKT